MFFLPDKSGDNMSKKIDVPIIHTQDEQSITTEKNNAQNKVHSKKFNNICEKIYAATNLDDILLNLQDDISDFFQAERMTVFVIDGRKRELVSRFKTGSGTADIRIPVSKQSIAGYVAIKQKFINIKNVYNDDELKAIDQGLTFDKTWDKNTAFITRQLLVFPIIFKKYLLGVLQLVNQKNNTPFTKIDENAAKELSNIIGVAIYNQKRIASAKTNKFDYLLANHIITQQELAKATSTANKSDDTVEDVLIKNFKILKKDIGKALSKFYGIPFVEFNNNVPIPSDLLMGLKVPFMRNNKWVPLRSENDKIVVAIDDPLDLQKVNEIKSLFASKSIIFNLALESDILNFIKLFTQDEKELAGIDEIISKMQDDDDEIEEAETGVNEQDSAVVQLVNKIIIDAFNRNASDIHIEPYPGKNNTHVRIRVDGACALYQTIPYAYKNAVVSRLKIMSDLDISERRKPQDGKIIFKKYGGLDIELRVATIPTQGGMEDVVMRILASGDPLPLAKMGFSKPNYDNFISAIIKPYGIVFVCGPTGSGKTTTLHSALSHINKTETKIWTAEDPVEITQAGLRQVQVKPKIGFDFSAAMRAFLRADPDVIMVGEMRDKETTSIGIEASLTGHLVFSTLHTNSAPESITRLLDMGMDPFNFADAILCILAQRLLRTLCKDCKKSYHPSQKEYDELVREYSPEDFKKQLSNISYTDDLMINKPAGCDACNNTGYRGRMGLHELLMGTDEQKKLIQIKSTMEDLKSQALIDGMQTLKQDGIQKIFSGNCDLLQVRKVCIK